MLSTAKLFDSAEKILPLIQMAPLFEADKVYSFFENDCAFAVLGDVATGKVAYENPLWAS